MVLAHQLTPAQLSALDELVEYGEQLQAAGLPAGRQGPLEERLDRACLRLSIALLDHTLKGDLYESAFIGFLAVLGVDAERRTFRDPFSYTSYLSGLVKMAQMLVVQQAVQMADDGTVPHPADALDEMRERFMLHGVRAPLGWVLRLRTYGKKIQNTTTSLCYIYWSDDHETLSHKELELSMASFRRFVRDQVEHCQMALEQLFLIPPQSELRRGAAGAPAA